MRVVSFEASFKKALFGRLADNLGEAAALYRDDIKEAIGIQGPPRSTPGNPPHKDTSELFNSIEDELDAPNLIARVSSDSDHALAMELGTSRGVAPRPYFVATLVANSDKYGREICKP